MMKIASVLFALILAAGGAAAQGVKVGYVNSMRIEQESVQATRAMEALKKEFEPREKKILALQKQIATDRERFDKERDKLSPADLKSGGTAIATMMRQSDRMALSLAADLETRKKERLVRVYQDANVAIKAVAEAGKFDLVLERATYVSPAIDITDRVLKEMAKRAGSGP